MEFRSLELSIASANDLKDVNLIGKMDVYAVVSLSGESHCLQKAKTPIDRDAGTSPIWNFPVRFTINETQARQSRLTLEIKILCHRALAADKEIGRVCVPVRELLNHPGDGKSFLHVFYQVRRPSGKPKGVFSFSYRFGGKIAAPAKPVISYPVPAAGPSTHSGVYPPQHATGYAYAPPSAPPYPECESETTGYGYPAQGGYGHTQPPESAPPYPHAQVGYGYPEQGGYGHTQPLESAPPYPHVQDGYGYPAQGGYGQPQSPVQKPGWNNFGMGLGAGLLGGLLIGEMMTDGGGFDF